MFNIMKKLKSFYWWMYKNYWKILSQISPKYASEKLYKSRFGKKLNLKNPTTFNEKLQKLKLSEYYKNNIITQCADKYKVREYIKKLGCDELLIKLLGVYDKFDDISWDDLPNKFVLKCNHGCGYNLICTDKRNLNYLEIKKVVDKWMKEEYWKLRAEVNYKYIPKKIVIEEYVDGGKNGLEDYKFYCFYGKVECILYCCERKNGHAKYFYLDKNWNLLPYSTDFFQMKDIVNIPKPRLLEKAIEYAELLSKEFPFVRTDLYEGDLELGKLLQI